jgi:hypothetical protein
LDGRQGKALSAGSSDKDRTSAGWIALKQLKSISFGFSDSRY